MISERWRRFKSVVFDWPHIYEREMDLYLYTVEHTDGTSSKVVANDYRTVGEMLFFDAASAVDKIIFNEPYAAYETVARLGGVKELTRREIGTTELRAVGPHVDPSDDAWTVYHFANSPNYDAFRPDQWYYSGTDLQYL